MDQPPRTTIPLGNGTFFVANLTFQVAAGAVPGMYSLGNSTSAIPGVGGRISVVNDSDGDTFPIANSPFNLPYPRAKLDRSSGYWLDVGGALAYRRRAAARQ